MIVAAANKKDKPTVAAVAVAAIAGVVVAAVVSLSQKQQQQQQKQNNLSRPQQHERRNTQPQQQQLLPLLLLALSLQIVFVCATIVPAAAANGQAQSLFTINTKHASTDQQQQQQQLNRQQHHHQHAQPQTHTQQQTSHHQHHHHLLPPVPAGSSSLSSPALVEDLTDSSIRTRAAASSQQQQQSAASASASSAPTIINLRSPVASLIPHAHHHQHPHHNPQQQQAAASLTTSSAASSSASAQAAQQQQQPPIEYNVYPEPAPLSAPNFHQLIKRLLSTYRIRDQINNNNQKNNRVSADPNNKTTMRFFRMGKTFGSIVYTNDAQAHKLINCHLVDLERHASDVALFETKYDIKTIDVEFREMMDLIDACTDIARFKPFRGTGMNMLTGNMTAAGTQPLAAGAPLTSTYNNTPVVPFSFQRQPATRLQSAFKPIMVVGRPLVAPGVASPIIINNNNDRANQYQKRYLAPAAATQSSSSSTLSGLHRFGPIKASLELLNGAAAATPPTSPHEPKLKSLRRPGSGPGALLSTLASLGLETSKRLVLREGVTAPPQAVDGHAGGIREALHEITSYDSSDLMSIWRGILPGTNWCGMGDRATSYNDLGFESDIDICCRAHDFCPIRLSAFSAGYGLFNWSFYTRSHCRCDQNFLDCLQRTDSPLSAVVLRFYFTIMKTTCLHDNETTTTTTNSDEAASAAAAAAAVAQPAAASTFSFVNQPQSQSQAQEQQAASAQQQQQAAYSPAPGASSKSQQFSNFNVQNNNNQYTATKKKQPQQQQPNFAPNTQEQHRLLLDQIRASLPIPALKFSRPLTSALEQRPAAAATVSGGTGSGYSQRL